jgi:tRNA pseudouridine55 synthase
LVGILNVDKPPGLTSAAVVARVRRSTGVTRVGHGGTLDPGASGVLPIFLGRATVLADWLSRQGKAYLAGIRLGIGSDTDDADGSLTPAGLPPGIDEASVATALAAFTGEVVQQPPAYSAVKVEGQRSYRRARRGDPSLPPARRVRVDSIRLVEMRMEPNGPLAVVEVNCGPGFYVRSLARDLGTSLGTRAHLASLSRTRVGCLRIEEAIALADLEEAGAGLDRFLQPAAGALAGVQSIRVSTGAVADLRLGRSVAVAAAAASEAYASDDEGRVLAIGRVLGGHFHPHRLVEA